MTQISEGQPVLQGTWSAGELPWVRRAAPACIPASTSTGGGAVCYFCGSDTVKLSSGDLPADVGRVQLYCDNADCAAREVTVIVERDGSAAARRADVRALRSVDHPERIGNRRVHDSGLLTRKPRGLPDATSLERRLNEDPLDLLIP